MALNWTAIDRLAKAHRLIDPTASEKDLWRALRLWWCLKYSRPFKDPLIDGYSLDELVYEYLVHYYLDPANDPAKKKDEEKAAEDDDAWIRKMLAGGGGLPTQPQPASADGIQAPPGGHIDVPVAPAPKETPAPEVVPDLPDISTSFEE